MDTGRGGDLSERRRRALSGALLIMLVIGATAIETASEHGEHWRSVDFVKVGSILLLAFILALRSTTNMRLRPRNPELDDELTRANRASAAGWGFWLLMPALLALFILNFYAPTPAREALPILIVAGAAAAGARFVFLERQGAK